MKTVAAFLKLIRVFNLLVTAASLSLFYYLLIVPAHQNKLFTTLLPFTNFEFVLFILSVVFVSAGGSIIHEYYEFEQDIEYKPHRPLVQGFFSLDTAMYLHAAFAFAGIGLGFYLGYSTNNFKIGYLYVICVLLLYFYSAYLKKIPLVGNIVVAALTGFVFVLLMLFEVTFLRTISFEGANYVLDMLLWQVKFYGGFIFAITFACEILKDLEDKKGDEAYGVNTFVVQFGEMAGKGLVLLVLGLVLVVLAFLMRRFIEVHAVKEFMYLTILVLIPISAAIILLFIANEEKQYVRVSLLLKIITLLGILSLPAFYFFNLPSGA